MITEDQLIPMLRPDYLEKILKNMVFCRNVWKKDVGVRFGLKGKGVHPNYQIEEIETSTIEIKSKAYSGVNHESAPVTSKNDEYNPENLSNKSYPEDFIKSLIYKR